MAAQVLEDISPPIMVLGPSMMPRSPSLAFTLSLCASLTLHALGFIFAERMYERSLSALGVTDAVSRQQATAGAEARAELGPLVMLAPPQSLPPEVRLGEADGTGAATDNSPGEAPMQGRKAEQDQPQLSRDPVGPAPPHQEPGDGLALPAPQAVPQVGLAAMSQPQEPMPQRAPRHVEAAADEGASHTTSARETSPEQTIGPDGFTSAPTPSAAPQASAATPGASGTAGAVAAAGAPPAVNTPVEGTPVADPPVAGTPAAGTPADSAPQGESESDAFSSKGSVEFRGGKVDARLGRRHRITRPHINLAGLVDTVSLEQLALLMELRIDSSGNVISARILRSSGSDQIDQACRLAAYEWWFEPIAGRSSETFTFGIHFY